MRIFLCHASDDKRTAEQIELGLEADGHEVFIDHELPRGDEYDTRIRNEIEACDLMVFLVTSASVQSGRYTLSELEILKQRFPHPRGRLLPVRLEPVPAESIPAYVLSVSILDVKGSAVAETKLAVAALARRRRRRLALMGAVGLAALVVAGGAGVALWPDDGSDHGSESLTSDEVEKVVQVLVHQDDPLVRALALAELPPERVPVDVAGQLLDGVRIPEARWTGYQWARLSESGGHVALVGGGQVVGGEPALVVARGDGTGRPTAVDFHGTPMLVEFAARDTLLIVLGIGDGGVFTVADGKRQATFDLESHDLATAKGLVVNASGTGALIQTSRGVLALDLVTATQGRIWDGPSDPIDVGFYDDRPLLVDKLGHLRELASGDEVLLGDGSQRRLAHVGRRNGWAVVWNETGRLAARRGRHALEFFEVGPVSAILSSTTHVACVLEEGVAVWNEKASRRLYEPNTRVRYAVLGSQHLITGAMDGAVNVWRMDVPGWRVSLPIRDGVADLQISADDKRLLTVSERTPHGSTIRSWRLDAEPLVQKGDDGARIIDRIRKATSVCLTASERVIFGSDVAEAEATAAACEHAHGRR